MNVTTTAPPSITAHEIFDRVSNSLPAGDYCLPGLLQLCEISITDAVPTACIECATPPVMHVSPTFVREHCKTNEHLVMLIMHEIHHLILGHTRLCPRATQLDNVVFDAIINSMLCQLFPDECSFSFFTEFYRSDRFPQCFLRPPPNWTGTWGEVTTPEALAGAEFAEAASVYARLYGDGCTYEELRAVMVAHAQAANDQQVTLLGDHSPEGEGSSSDEAAVARAPCFFREIRNIIDHWPKTDRAGRAWGAAVRKKFLARKAVSNQSRLRRLLQRIGKPRNGAESRLRRVSVGTTNVSAPIARLDRRSIVARSLGAQLLLPSTSVSHRVRTPITTRTHVYLDVSGSMNGVLAAVLGAMHLCREFVHPTVHQFSTRIVDTSMRTLLSGEISSTGGTEIACVLTHMRTHNVKRAVIITDGLVGAPSPEGAEWMRGARIGVALTPGSQRSDLEAHVTEFVQLQQ